MKLNNDLIRELLLTFEEIEYEEIFILENNLDKPLLKMYSDSEIFYHVRQLEASDLIVIKPFADGTTRIFDLTPSGHNFIANIRSDTNWSKIKDIATLVGSKSLDAIIQISSNVITELIRYHFKLF